MVSIIEYVQKNFNQGGKVNVLLYSGSGGYNGAVTSLFYSNRAPLVIGKISRGYTESLKIEFENLLSIQNILKTTPLSKTIPFPLQFVNISGYPVFFMCYLPGIRGDSYLVPFSDEKVSRLLHNATNWLIDFLFHTKGYRDKSNLGKHEALQSWISDELLKKNQFVKHFLENDQFFSAPVHGDLVCTNLLFNKNGEVTGVIDFQNFSIKGFPVTDLMDLLLSTGSVLFGYTSNMIEKIFFDSNTFSLIVKDCVKQFCKACDLDIENLIHVLPVYSEKAIWKSNKLNSKKLYNFHIELRKKLIENQNTIIWNK